ncbi:MAG: HAD family hydrolase [Betaproteobacteria bacterium]|nr:HAD family hydrolase [Betaproteobacteria bacterium]MDE2622279.1 HAD family hydrolase [Betaproteobacteria bacterium]
MRLTLFDLDNTLLSGDSDFEWGLFLASQGVHDREAYEARNLAFYEAYKAGTLDIGEFLQFQLGPLGRHSREELDRWHRQFMKSHILPLISDAARTLVRQEQERSDLVAIVTATNRFVTAPIASEFGISHLVATEPEVGDDGQFTGSVRGIPCFREGKIACVNAWLASLGRRWSDFDTTVFYSDSLNDLPLLTHVTHPVAVNPDPTLRAHAHTAHWPILELAA